MSWYLQYYFYQTALTFFVLSFIAILNKMSNKQLSFWWFWTPRHQCDITVMNYSICSGSPTFVNHSQVIPNGIDPGQLLVLSSLIQEQIQPPEQMWHKSKSNIFNLWPPALNLYPFIPAVVYLHTAITVLTNDDWDLALCINLLGSVC